MGRAERGLSAVGQEHSGGPGESHPLSSMNFYVMVLCLFGRS